jgi:hypothetical protein
LPRDDFPPLRFAERAFDFPADFFPRPLPRLDFPPLDFFPREAVPFAFLPFDFARAGAFFELLALFLAARFAPPRFFEADDAFLVRAFDALLAGRLALAATARTAFLTFGAAALLELAARPASAPSTPPTTAPTGPATLPSTAPVAAPAVCFEIGGISMFSEVEPALSVDF